MQTWLVRFVNGLWFTTPVPESLPVPIFFHQGAHGKVEVGRARDIAMAQRAQGFLKY
jgi:hypothetical protein